VVAASFSAAKAMRWAKRSSPLPHAANRLHNKKALRLGIPVPMKVDILRPTYRVDLLPKHVG